MQGRISLLGNCKINTAAPIRIKEAQQTALPMPVFLFASIVFNLESRPKTKAELNLNAIGGLNLESPPQNTGLI